MCVCGSTNPILITAHVQAGWLTLVIVVGDNVVKLYQCLKLLVRLMELVSRNHVAQRILLSHTL